MRPSWFSSLGKDVYEPALKKLDELVGVQDFQFNTPVGSTTVHWCDPKRLLLGADEVKTAVVNQFVRTDKNCWLVFFGDGKSVEATTLIIAAGIWTKMFVPEVDVRGQAGVAWLRPANGIETPFIKVWAPYKQVVAFNRGDGLWIGDGLSLSYWNDAYENASRERCDTALLRRASFIWGPSINSPKAPEVVKLFGYRPYVKDAKPCYLKEVRKNLWVATGGAKNGTLAAGWCADQIVRKLA
jgi:glycine/D-amino acid oxidase-like deaminating enzyme